MLVIPVVAELPLGAGGAVEDELRRLIEVVADAFGSPPGPSCRCERSCRTGRLPAAGRARARRGVASGRGSTA